MPSATTKPISVVYLPISNPGDMGEALAAALTIGYRGQVTAYLDVANQPVWTLELNGPGNPKPVVANVGDVIVWDSMYLRTMPEAEFMANYTP